MNYYSPRQFSLILFFTKVLVFFSLIAQAGIDHLEPPFWWAGMKNPKLQILVHGENIAQLEPQIDYAGIKISQVIKVENPNYLFVDLIIDGAHPGTFTINFNRGKNTVEQYEYTLRERQEGSAERRGFTTSDAMYLVTPDRFVNGDPGNDDMEGLLETSNRQDPNGRHGGDIKGMVETLDYIKGLGFTAIWLNPVLENNQPEFSYHGYSTTDYYKVDPRYGSNEDYAKLGQLSKRKGIKLIMDMITNHCGSEHWWMKDLPASDWINFDNHFVKTNHRKPTIQDPYRSEYDYRHFVDGWFVETMPDLNHHNPLLATYLIQNTLWWIEYAGLAGIRMDTYPYNDMDFLTQWTCAVMDEYPDFNITGEEWNNNPLIVRFWQRGNQAGYQSCLPSMLDFPLQEAMRKSLVEEKEGGAFNPSYEMLANDFVYANPENFVIFPDNHDMDRFYSQVKEDIQLFKLGLVYFATMRGIPQIYYGTEMLLTNQIPGDHGLIRADFPGGWNGDAVNGFTGNGLSDDQTEALSFTSFLFNWRKDAAVIHSGKVMHFAPDKDVYVFFRYTPEGKVMIILNRSHEEQNLDLERFKEMLDGLSEGRDVLTDQRYLFGDQLTVPARTPVILELD